jgi:hypothetical protein
MLKLCSGEVMLSFIVSIVIAADCLISQVVITHEVSKAHRSR